ncbi:MAG: hypothetical protein GC178_04490 [Flavobacteriales bacterium]|nr:hypothetical protein [Flavobacteriales bacterium]
MKQLFFLLAINLIVGNAAFSQDVIYMLNGDEVEAKLTEISSSELKYKRMDNLDGPVFVIERNKVFKVKYANGQSEVMTKPGAAPAVAAAPASAPSYSNTTSSAAPPTSSGPFNAATFKADGNYFNNQPYVLDQATGKLIQLEKGKPEIKTSTVAAPFYASSSSSWMMRGDRSTVRLSSNGGFNFVVKFAPGLDPMDYIRLVRFDLLARGRRDPAKDRHMPSTKTTGSWGGASSEHVSGNDIQFDIKRLDDGVYEIIPKSALPPNEYGFYIMHKFYAFGID